MRGRAAARHGGPRARDAGDRPQRARGGQHRPGGAAQRHARPGPARTGPDRVLRASPARWASRSSRRPRKRGLGLSTFVSAGNRADLSGNDMLQYWQTDPATDVVLLYLETFGNPRKFARVARRLARTKPIVAVKSGRHTRPRRGARRAHRADRRRQRPRAVRAGRASSGSTRSPQLFDTALLLAYQPLPAGPRVAVVGNSTALGVLVADALVGEGMQLAGDPVDIGVTASPEDVRRRRRRRARPRRGRGATRAQGLPTRWSPCSCPRSRRRATRTPGRCARRPPASRHRPTSRSWRCSSRPRACPPSWPYRRGRHARSAGRCPATPAPSAPPRRWRG